MVLFHTTTKLEKSIKKKLSKTQQQGPSVWKKNATIWIYEINQSFHNISRIYTAINFRKVKD